MRGRGGLAVSSVARRLEGETTAHGVRCGARVLGRLRRARAHLLINESHNVRLEHDSSKTLTVLQEMVWDDKSHPTREIRFPAGTYGLEAEDPDYWYMRSPAPLNLREFKKGVQTQSQNIRGGIALGKYTTRSVPAAGYI